MSITPEYTPDNNPMRDFYLNSKEIKVFGTVNNPLFCYKQVAAYIGDINMAKKLQKIKDKNPEYIVKCLMRNVLGKVQEVDFLTEPGLFCYLSRNDKLPKAHRFNSFVVSKMITSYQQA